MTSVLSKKLIPWQIQHGRHDLPWQYNPTPYRVWISEIMLQQTQVETVKAYYVRFMHRFPALDDLAHAVEDEVLQLWTGLGYYARARHLHRAAKIIVNDYQGQFPDTLDELVKLPGIGRSTAGAILSLGMHQSAVILDGNVKRVLTRFHAIKSWPGETKVLQQLWELASAHTPRKDAHIYNQALMDLGAMICTRKAPKCPLCPLRKNCLAYAQKIQENIPKPKPKKTLPEKHGFILILFHKKQNAILLEKRPAPGIWGGLWSFPECPKPGKRLDAFLPRDATYTHNGEAHAHTFTHYRWHLTPVFAKSSRGQVLGDGEYMWYKLDHSTPIALAAPVKHFTKGV